MSKQKVVHTGANRCADGFHICMLSALKHRLLLAFANSPIVILALSQIRIAIMSFQNDDMLFLFSHVI